MLLFALILIPILGLLFFRVQYIHVGITIGSIVYIIIYYKNFIILTVLALIAFSFFICISAIKEITYPYLIKIKRYVINFLYYFLFLLTFILTLLINIIVIYEFYELISSFLTVNCIKLILIFILIFSINLVLIAFPDLFKPPFLKSFILRIFTIFMYVIFITLIRNLVFPLIYTNNNIIIDFLIKGLGLNLLNHDTLYWIPLVMGAICILSISLIISFLIVYIIKNIIKILEVIKDKNLIRFLLNYILNFIIAMLLYLFIYNMFITFFEITIMLPPLLAIWFDNILPQPMYALSGDEVLSNPIYTNNNIDITFGPLFASNSNEDLPKYVNPAWLDLKRYPISSGQGEPSTQVETGTPSRSSSPGGVGLNTGEWALPKWPGSQPASRPQSPQAGIGSPQAGIGSPQPQPTPMPGPSELPELPFLSPDPNAVFSSRRGSINEFYLGSECWDSLELGLIPRTPLLPEGPEANDKKFKSLAVGLHSITGGQVLIEKSINKTTRAAGIYLDVPAEELKKVADNGYRYNPDFHVFNDKLTCLLYELHKAGVAVYSRNYLRNLKDPQHLDLFYEYLRNLNKIRPDATVYDKNYCRINEGLIKAIRYTELKKD